MITTSAAQYVYQEKINYFGAQRFFVCIVLTLLWACCSLVMKVDKGLIYLFIYFLFIHCFNVLKWRCKADHAFSTPKLTKRERERNLKVRRITLPYRPYTHRNPSKDIDLLRHPLFPRGLSEGWANHVSLILPMLTARHWALAHAMRRDVRKTIVNLAADVSLVKKTAVIGKLNEPSIRLLDE